MPSNLALVGDQLGKATGVSLDALGQNGYTRTHAVSGYRRVNPFQVENGSAEDPATWNASGPHSLDDWTGYNQAGVAGGSQLAHTLKPGGVDLTWTKPAGYDRAPAILDQQVYAKDTGQTSANEPALSTDPFNIPDTSQSAGDGTTKSLSLLSAIGNMVAIGVLAEFDDSVEVHETPHSVAYSAAAGEDPLTGAGAGILVGPIPGTEPTLNSLTQSPHKDSCQVNSNITLEVNLSDCAGEVFLAEAVDGGGFGADFSVGTINGSAQIDLTRQSNHTYTIKARYAGGSYSPTKNHFLECTQL